jgi:hypothetical protein
MLEGKVPDVCWALVRETLKKYTLDNAWSRVESTEARREALTFKIAIAKEVSAILDQGL